MWVRSCQRKINLLWNLDLTLYRRWKIPIFTSGSMPIDRNNLFGMESRLISSDLCIEVLCKWIFEQRVGGITKRTTKDRKL